MKNETITAVTVSADTLRQLKNVSVVDEIDFNDLVSAMIERGLKDLIYRKQRNQKKWAETKALQQTVKELQDKLAEK